MRIKRVYIDTSVVGGYFDKEFKVPTRALFKLVENRDLIFVTSDLMELELNEAPQNVRQLLHRFPDECFEKIAMTNEAFILAEKYISENVVGKASIEDCRHIALATIYKVDVLISWNFKHIVNLERIKGYNSVNLKLGYPFIEIRSPREILHYENLE